MKKDPAIVVVDPGHGGADAGAVHFDLRESDLNLAIAQKLEAELRRIGYVAPLTREDDRWVALPDRAKMANQAGADCLVSVHCNAFRNGSAEGIETLCHDLSSFSAALGRAIQEELSKSFPYHKDRGLKERNDVAVLRLSQMPAALVECEFLSNREQAAFLADESNQAKIAAAIGRGVQRFLGPS